MKAKAFGLALLLVVTLAAVLLLIVCINDEWLGAGDALGIPDLTIDQALGILLSFRLAYYFTTR